MISLIPGLPTVGGTELIIFLVIILLLFGAKRIPELARGLGSGVREFRSGVRGDGEEKKDPEKLTAGGVDGTGEEDVVRAEQQRPERKPQ